MNWRLAVWSGLGAAALLAMIGGAWLLSLPPAPAGYGMHRFDLWLVIGFAAPGDRYGGDDTMGYGFGGDIRDNEQSNLVLKQPSAMGLCTGENQ